MPILIPNREYRSFNSFELVDTQKDEEQQYIVKGRAIVFNTSTCLYEYGGIKYSEIVDSRAFNGADMSDVIFNYNHHGKVVARLRNNTLNIKVEQDGLYMEAYLKGTAEGRTLFEEIKGGYIDKMSFSFLVADNGSEYDEITHTRTITKIKKLYDVAAVDIPAYEQTSISARSFFEEAHSKEFAALAEARRRKLLIAKTLL